MQNHTVILVHGAWHGSWCWTLVTQHLAGRGIASVAVDLDGHGLKSRSPVTRWSRPFNPAAYSAEPATSVTATAAAATLVDQVRAIGGGAPCVVVAHSMGGIIATAAAEQAPELFARLVYVSAFAPVSGLPSESYFAVPEAAGGTVATTLAADPAVVGALRIDPGDPGRHAAIRDAFYGDVDDVTAAAAISLLTSDASAGVSSETFPVTPGRYGTIPHTYVTCAKDNAVPIALQHRFIAEIDAVSRTPTTVAALDSSHSPFLSQPAALAAVIAQAFEARPLAAAGQPTP